MVADRIRALTVPKLGMTMKEGTIGAWHVEEGAAVKEGDPVVDVETEKIATECQAPISGVLRRRVARQGMTLPVGALVAVFADAEVSGQEIDTFIAAFTPERQA
jgi:pyruvate dehydrogenase E2 component (dihydrolipoamide acetyltransferase)